MLLTLIAVMLLFQVLLTAGAIAIWNMVKRESPQALPKVFFLTTLVRLLASTAFFAVALYVISADKDGLKLFTAIFIITYLLLLVFDTMYFYFSSKAIDNTHKTN